MDRDSYNTYCASLKATHHVIQWGGADVWKVGDATKSKVFAIAGWDDGLTTGITFKVSDMAFHILKEQEGLRPAPYLASRGMLWIQHYAEPGLSDEELKSYVQQSHQLVSAGLSKKLQKSLGLA